MTESTSRKKLLTGGIVFLLAYLAVIYVSLVAMRARELHGLFLPGFGLLGGDFFNIWSAARLALEGRAMDLFDSQRFYEAQKMMLGADIGFRPFFYPLFLLPFAAGFGLLAFPAALGVYLVLTFVFYAAAVAARRPKPWGIVLALLLSPASFETIVGGQNGFLTAALFIGGLRLLSAQPVLAGVLLGLLSIKPQLCLLVPVALVAGKHWKTLFSAAAAFIALAGGSVLLFGIEVWQAYIHVSFPAQRELIESGVNKVFNTMMAVTPFMAARILGASLPCAYGVCFVFMAAAAAAVFWAFRRPGPPALRESVLVTATFLAPPYLLVYDMPSLSAMVIGLLVWQGTAFSWRVMAMLLAVWLLPFAVTPFNEAGLPIVSLVIAAYLAVQMALLRKFS
jgi:alpha-1,2-mannosyltransferase